MEPEDDEPALSKPKKVVYHTYSLDVKNIGDDVRNVKVQLFRNEANFMTKYGLLPAVESVELSKKKAATLFMFPILDYLNKRQI